MGNRGIDDIDDYDDVKDLIELLDRLGIIDDATVGGILSELSELEEEFDDVLAEIETEFDWNVETASDTNDAAVYSCDKCNRRFSSESQYKQHLKGHRASTQSPNKCDECGKRFRTTEQYETHVASQHTDSSKETQTETETNSVNISTSGDTDYETVSPQSAWVDFGDRVERPVSVKSDISAITLEEEAIVVSGEEETHSVSIPELSFATEDNFTARVNDTTAFVAFER